MKAKPTKFAKLPKPPKLSLGGLMKGLTAFGETDLGKGLTGALSAAPGLLGGGGISGASAIAQPAGNLGQSEVAAGNVVDLTGDSAKKAAQANASREGAFGVVQGIGDMAIQSGFAPAMIGGAVLKGVGALGKALGIGQGAVDEAERKKKLMEQTSAQASVARQGAVNRNSIQTFKAPAYGKRGMKLRTSKFSKPC